MAIAPKTSRTTLKSFFKKNAIPTEGDFAQLIDSAINQADDGIAKPDGQPLSLQPDARDSGDKTLLNFFKSFADKLPAWTLSLNPGGRPGWSLGDSERRSRLFIDEATGHVGIGPQATAPRSALDTGTGVISGAANDYQKAQFTLSGGGLVSWDGVGGFLRWSERFIAISAERGGTFSDGHVNIFCPTINALVTSHDGVDRIVEGVAGVRLHRHWEALYAVHEVGQDPNQVRFRVEEFRAANFHAPSNWLLVAVVNSDNGSIKLGTGAVVAAGSNYASRHGSSLPKGAIIMWSGTEVPEGWALCDGAVEGRPNLSGRFVLGAGQGAGLSPRALNDPPGGTERHKLVNDEMPLHAHNIDDPAHVHTWFGTPRQAGNDPAVSNPDFARAEANTDTAVFGVGTSLSSTGIRIMQTGGDQSHENMPPFFVLAYIIKL